jgi:hypothetical protein
MRRVVDVITFLFICDLRVKISDFKTHDTFGSLKELFMNLEFAFADAPIVFHVEELDAKLRDVHERAVRRAQTYLVSEGELLESIIEVDQHKLYEKFGHSYLTTYRVKHLGLDENVAGVLVRVARKSQAIPELKQAVVAGELSISSARTIASVITQENQSEWISKAKSLSKHKLEREVAAISPAKAKPEKARHIGGGRVQIVLNLSEEEFERRGRIKDLVSQSLCKAATDSEVEVAMMDCYQFHKDPVRKAERAAKRKCKETDTSRDGSVKSGKPIPIKGHISAQEQQASAKGENAISMHVTHAVNLRDLGCCQARYADGSVCGRTRWTHLHHLIPRSRGGLDVLENLITLCSAHHRLWHKRENLSHDE